MGSAYEQFTKRAPAPLVKKVVKAGAYLKDLGEIPSRGIVPKEYVHEGPSEQLRDLLMSPEQARALLKLTEQFPDNSIYRARERVGSKEKGTIHPHDFVVERSGQDTYLYFVDPEQSLQSKIRPCAVYIEAMHLSSTSAPEVALFRCRTPDLSNPQDIKADALLQEARKLIVNRGMPEFMKSESQREVTMRLLVTGQESVAQIQSNLTINQTTISELLKGRVQSPLLEGIIRGHQTRIQQFTRLLEKQQSDVTDSAQPKFEALANEKYKI